MILSEKLLSLTKRISTLENTQEEQIKWQSAYLEIFEKGFFVMNRDNLEKLVNANVVDSPLTTYGEISLIKHIKRVNIDYKQLAKTTEIAVRFLDGCLDVINFSSEARDKINQFRKIGLGVADFDAYCIQSNQEQNKAIYPIAETIAKSAYRASESLGIDRGPIANLELSKSYNKGKIFSHWLRQDAEDLLNGYELKKLAQEDKIDINQYTQVPRRNSHILLFPNQEIWFPFTDRVEQDYIPYQEDVPLPNDTEFAKGELVEVVDHNLEQFGKIYQIIDIKSINKKYQYILKGEGLTANQIWDSSCLKSVDLNYVLQKLNFDNLASDNIFFTYALVINKEDNAVLIDKNTGYIPQFVSKEELSPEAILISGFKDKYNLDADILDEIGSVKEAGSIGIAYWVAILNDSCQELVWIDISEMEQNPHFQVISNKLNRKKKIYQRYESIIIKLEQDKEKLNTSSTSAKSILLLQERKNNNSLRDRINRLLGKVKPTKEFLRLGGSAEVESFDYDDKKYVLSLQQNILTDEFGSIRIIMEYSKTGLKSLQLYPEKFDPNSRFLLDLYLEMINLGLQYGMDKSEYSDLLYKYEREIPINQLYEVIKIIRKTLLSAPDTFSELSNKVY
jgi:hypothetical protein